MPTTTCEHLCGCRRGPNVEQGKWYGVRSYLHLFYEDCTGANLDDDLGEPMASPASNGWMSVLWKVTLSAGSLLMLIGGAALATGYLLSPKLEGIGEAEFVVLDQQAVEYNHALGICRAVGMVLCAIAGALLVTCVLSSGLARMNKGEEANKEALLSPIVQQGRWGVIVTEPPVPLQASRVQCVQPKREP
ncbi:neurensin-2 [Sceloporus undulatus]|uniref:neurensin-2 n=1 Tax=Sceloporus undulatus TaxID=8520 RepID=UPI001C4B3066|nr:neurensin-2 [Sceloporus undulatus]